MKGKKKFPKALTAPKKIIALIVFILVLIVYYNLDYNLFATRNSNESNSSKTMEISAKKKFKNILYWQKFFSYKGMSLGLGSKIFQDCSYSNCFATMDKNYLPVEEFDAVVFHGPEYHRYWFSSWQFGVPSKRSPEQVYIFLSLESPTSSHISYRGPADFYNWTITYRTDSDVFRPYGYVVNQPTNSSVLTEEEISKKKKKIAWFVSNCHVSSKREKLYERMSKFMAIDVYGKCGKLSCAAEGSKDCYKMIEQDYKFYLSFENSLCEDYVTEKLFRVLEYNVVPVVYGGADYAKFAPNNSVINVRDFQSTKSLMEYLQFLDDNPKEYQKFFEWKSNYVVEREPKKAVCDLCRKLNENKKERKSIFDIYEWVWGKNHRNCFNDWFDTFT